MVCMVIGQGLSEIPELPLCSQDIVMAHHVNTMLLESLLSPRPPLRGHWAWFLSCQGIWSIICMTLDCFSPVSKQWKNSELKLALLHVPLSGVLWLEIHPDGRAEATFRKERHVLSLGEHTVTAWKRNGMECRVTLASRAPQGANGTAYSLEIKQNSPQGAAAWTKTKSFSSPSLTNGTGGVAPGGRALA